VVRKAGDLYIVDGIGKKSIGQISHFLGNINVVIKAYAYLLTIGKDNLRDIAKLSTLNANYVKESLKSHYKLPVKQICKHEFVFDGLKENPHGLKALDVAKRLLDFDMHPPTVYFPLLYRESMMVEPPENESKQTLDAFIDIMKKIAKEAKEDPDTLRSAPLSTPVRRLDEAQAARNPRVKFKDLADE